MSAQSLLPPLSTPRVTNPLEDLARRFHSAVHRRARQILGNEEDAADVAQEVFLCALRAREGALQSHPQAWLYRVTTNLCLNRIRDSRRRREFLSEAADLSDSEPVGVPPEVSTLHELLGDVPRDLLSPAVYYYVEGLSHAEIAMKLRVSRRTIGNRIVAFHALVRELQARASDTPKHVPSVDR